MRPQATTVPSDFNARPHSFPADTATTSERPSGTSVSPKLLLPQATTVLSGCNARLICPAPEIKFEGFSSLKQSPHSLIYASPFGTPAQSAHELLSPSQTPHSSSSKVELQVLSQPEVPASKQPHPRLSTSPPSQTPHSSLTNVDPHTLSQPDGS